MSCTSYQLGDATVISCSRGRVLCCVGCSYHAEKLCDAHPDDGKTCSNPVCDACVWSQDGEDFCPLHKPSHIGLRVFTARVNYRGSDAFDVTRGGAMRAASKGLPFLGEPFAPSRKILTRALDQQKTGEEDWAEYEQLYLGELRATYRTNRGAFELLLKRNVVTLLCYCTDAERCHRTVLAKVLVKLGAIYGGER